METSEKKSLRAAISENLGLAGKYAQVGRKNFPMESYPWIIRWFAKLVGRIILFFTRVITIPQTTFNNAMLKVAENTFEYHENKYNSLSRMNASVVLQVEKMAESVESRFAEVFHQLDSFSETARRLESSADEIRQGLLAEISNNAERVKNEVLQTFDEQIQVVQEQFHNEIIANQEASQKEFHGEIIANQEAFRKEFHGEIIANQEAFRKEFLLLQQAQQNADGILNETASSLERQARRYADESIERFAAKQKEELENRMNQISLHARTFSEKISQYKSELDQSKEGTSQALKDTNQLLMEQGNEMNYLKTDLLLQQRRLELFLQEARKRLPNSFNPRQLEVFSQELNRLHDPLYLKFEDKFRGTRDEIKRRFSKYIPYIRETYYKKNDGLVIDLGCGRGEWIELLKEQSIGAVGVDINETVVEDCRKKGLEALRSDILEYLNGMPDSSVNAVTGFHIMEHLPFPVLLNLFDECLRVLAPGGVAIFETPNPGNVVVGSHYFYFDPTHRNPLPSLSTKFLFEARGFCRVEILESSPLNPALIREAKTEIEKQCCRLLFGPQDYAVIGYKVE